MLTFAITTLFSIAFFGSLAVIANMFWQYRAQIETVVAHGLGLDDTPAEIELPKIRTRPFRARQFMNQHRSLKAVPLRAAA